MHFEKTLDDKEIFSGNVFRVVEQTVELENKNIVKRQIVRHNGGAAVIAVDDDRCVCLVRQFRKPVDREVLEIPAGRLEPGENPFQCAVRELLEETGLTASKMEPLGMILTTPGFCDEVLHLYLATGLTTGVMRPDPDEFLSCERIPLVRCAGMVENGEIADSKTIIAILRTARKYGV